MAASRRLGAPLTCQNVVKVLSETKSTTALSAAAMLAATFPAILFSIHASTDPV
jgi:hypothetical protein